MSSMKWISGRLVGVGFLAVLAVVGLAVAGCGGGSGEGDGGSSGDGGGSESAGVDGGSGGSSSDSAMDPGTPRGAMLMFADAMADVRLAEAAEITDPESPAREMLMNFATELDRIEANEEMDPASKALARRLMENIFSRPYEDIDLELITDEGGVALVNVTYKGIGDEGADVTQEARLNRFEDVWLLYLTEDLLQPSQALLREIGAEAGREMGGGGAGGGGGEGGGAGGEGGG